MDTLLSGNLIQLPLRITATGVTDDIHLLKTVSVYNNSSIDLALSASTDPVVPNQSFSYHLDFGNISGSSLSNLVLRAYLPAGVSLNTISDNGTEVAPGVVEWSAISLASGNAARREISVTADSVIAGENLTLVAKLSHSGGLEIDKQSEYSISVTPAGGIASLLSLDISASPEPVAADAVLSYTLTVTNNYGLPINNVLLLLRVPGELSFHHSNNASPASSNCGNTLCTGSEEAVWSFATIAAGASEVITLNANVLDAILDGNLIVAPFRVSAENMIDSINIQHVTVLKN